MSYRYFAYGSTLDRGHLTEWASDHGYAGLVLEDGLPAALDDHELAVTVPSRYWMGSVGTIAPRPGATVYGILFELPDEQADVIRHKEGVASGLFREVEVEVRLYLPDADDATVQLVPASTFRAVDERMSASPPPPSSRWLEIAVRGAQQRGLPDLWLAELRRRGKGVAR